MPLSLSQGRAGQGAGHRAGHRAGQRPREEGPDARLSLRVASPGMTYRLITSIAGGRTDGFACLIGNQAPTTTCGESKGRGGVLRGAGAWLGGAWRGPWLWEAAPGLPVLRLAHVQRVTRAVLNGLAPDSLRPSVSPRLASPRLSKYAPPCRPAVLPPAHTHSIRACGREKARRVSPVVFEPATLRGEHFGAFNSVSRRRGDASKARSDHLNQFCTRRKK